MKILRLDLRAFGPFTGVSLDLSGGNHGFHLIYGANEAGKSSALRALGQLLYGIPGNSPDNFVHLDYKKLRIGALLAKSDGKRLEIVRRKGVKGTLLSPDESLIEEGQLQSFLGGCDQAQFKTMFGIDHPTLVKGGQEIAGGQGEVGHVLFAAGAGIADLRAIRTSLEKEADDLFRPSAAKPAINQALAALREAKARIRESLLPSSEWVKHDKARQDAIARLEVVDSEIDDQMRRKTCLERLARALPAIARCKQIESSLAELGDVPVLAADFSEKRRDAIARLDAAEKAEAASIEEIDRLDNQMEKLAVPENLLVRSDEIDAVYRDLSVYRKAANDLPSLHARKNELEKSAAEILRELRPDLSLDETDQLRLNRRQHVEIQNLGNRREALEKQLAAMRGEIAESMSRLSEAVERSNELPETCDTAPLADAIRQARNLGNIELQSSELCDRLAATIAQAEIELAKLGLWSGPLAALEKLCLPAMETIDRFDRDLSGLEQKLTRAEESFKKTEADAAEVARQIEHLRLEGDVPSEDDLDSARRLRERGWRLVLREWRQSGVDPAETGRFLESLGETNDLAAAYEHSVRKTDELADRLRREANRVAKRVGLDARRLALQNEAAKQSQQRADLRLEFDRIEREWIECWRPMDIAPLTPREMRAWAQSQQALGRKAAEIRGLCASLDQMNERIARHGDELKRQLSRIEPQAGDEYFANSLAGLLTRCEATVERIEANTLERNQIDRDVSRLKQGLVAARSKLDQVERELKECTALWTASIVPLGLDIEAEPSVVNEVISQTNELFARLKETQGLIERINQIGEDGRKFRAEVVRLVEAIDPGRETSEAFDRLAEDMFARLRRATVDQKNLDVLQAQRDAETKKREAMHATVEAMRATLRVLCQEARCETVEQLPAAERASAEVLAHRARLESCREELSRLSAGASIEAVTSEAESLHADEAPAQLLRLSQRISDLDIERGALRETIGGEKKILETMDDGHTAADAAEEVQNLVASIEPNVQQFLRLRLAAAVLREGIDRYRKKNEGPVLARASEMFSRLTLGAFSGLRIDFDDRGQQILAGVRKSGDAIVPSAMSEGTSDQLYLALRLASLETWLDRNEPLPFIVDDILVSFDNERAIAAIELLAELSARTQVIFFAHHAHLVELAQRTVSPDTLFIHDLAK